MKTVTTWIVAALCLLLGFLLMGSVIGAPRTPPVALAASQVGSDPEEPTGDPVRGEYLATAFACVDCHTKRTADGIRPDEDVLLAGGVEFSGSWGTIYSVNLTEIAPALGAGDLERIIRGEQHFLYPMPTGNFYYMAEQDMDDLIAYLQTVPFRATTIPPNDLDPTYKLPAPLLPSGAIPRTAPTGATVERGAYLVQQGACNDCHTPKTADDKDVPGRFLAGGIPYEGPNNTTLYSRNLTPDETGLATWSDAQIIRAFRQGVSKSGRTLNPIMPYGVAYHILTDEDALAIVRYLRTIPAVRNPLPNNPDWQPPANSSGSGG